MALRNKTRISTALHAHKSERDEPRIHVLVADHERHEPSRFEQVIRVPRDQTDLIQESCFRWHARKIPFELTEADNVVIGRVQDDAVSRVDVPFPQRGRARASPLTPLWSHPQARRPERCTGFRAVYGARASVQRHLDRSQRRSPALPSRLHSMSVVPMPLKRSTTTSPRFVKRVKT